jgi:MarR family transcriptional regulator, organic hydroperoxide resistance regulator
MAKRDSARDYPLSAALDFLQRLWRLNHALEKLSSRMDRELGVTAQQRFMLRCIGKYPGLTAGQLAALLHVDPGTVSAALRRLEAKGLLQRHRNPRDRRRASLGLTAQGRALDAPAQHSVEHAVELLLASTSPKQLAAMISVVESLAQLLSELAAQPPAAGKRPAATKAVAPGGRGKRRAKDGSSGPGGSSGSGSSGSGR